MFNLRNIEIKDINEIITWVTSEKEVMQWAGPSFKLKTLKDDMLNELNHSLENPDKIKIFKTVYNEQLCGYIRLAIDIDNESGFIGKVIIAPKYRDQGFGKKLMNKMLKYAFETLQLNMISLFVFDFNIPAIKTYEKCGFLREGLLRNRRKIGSEYWSLVPMSILREEFNKIIN